MKLVEIFLDARLVLRGRRHDARFGDRPVGFEPVAVIEQPARRLGRAEADAGARRDRDGRRLFRLLVGGDDPQRLVAGVEHLDRADHDAAVGIGAGSAEPGRARRLLRERRQTVEIQAVAGERSDEVGAAAAKVRVQRRRALDLRFLEMLVVLRQPRYRARGSRRCGPR